MTGCCAVPSTSLVWASESATPVSFPQPESTSDASAVAHAGRSAAQQALSAPSPAPTSPLRRLHITGSAAARRLGSLFTVLGVCPLRRRRSRAAGPP